MDCLEQKEFLQWNTRTKDHLCANFQDIWLSSKSWISDIKYAISTTKMQILNQFFLQKDSLYCCYMCAKFSSTCKIIFIFSCILSSVLWDNFLWMTLYQLDCNARSNVIPMAKTLASGQQWWKRQKAMGAPWEQRWKPWEGRNDKKIEQVKEIKYLGIKIDQKLNWKEHIKTLETKLSQACGAICKMRHYVDRDCLRAFYFGNVYSHLQ